MLNRNHFRCLIIRACWLPVLLFLGTSLPVLAAPPEADIVAVESVQPLGGEDPLSGLLEGRHVTDALRGALELVRGDVPEAARPGVVNLLRRIRQLRDGQRSGLTRSTRGRLWLPVRAQRLRVRLDAPNLLPRPTRNPDDPLQGDLKAWARRTDWLPLDWTQQQLERALPLLGSGHMATLRARQLLESVLQGIRPEVRLEQRPLILAYYRVESALAAAPDWPAALRPKLRRAASALEVGSQAKDLQDLGERLQAQADRSTPDVNALQSLAADLRRRIGKVAAPASDDGGT